MNNESNEFLAGVLRQAARALAGYAAQELLEKHPEARKGFEPDPFAGWQNWLAQRVEELAAAAAAERPTLFVSQVQWGKAVLDSRGIATESFHRGLECLRSVLAGELPEHVQRLATEYVDQALETFDETPVELTARRLPDTPMGHLAANYILSLLQGDRRRASRLILDMLDQGYDVCDLYLHVLLPAQEELGRMWLTNEINVAEEHFASHTTKMVMAQLLPHATFQPSNGKTMLAAAVAGNQHDIGLQAVADFFEMDGWRTVLLGADVPPRDLVEAVSFFLPDLLGLSISQTTQLSAAKMAVEAVRMGSHGSKVRIILGGRALFDDGALAGDLGADGYATSPMEAVGLGRQLIGLPPETGKATG